MLSEKDSPEVHSWRGPHGGRFSRLQLVGGVDISFNKADPEEACAIVVVLSFPQLQVLLCRAAGHNLQRVCVLQLTAPTWTTPPPSPPPGGAHVLYGVPDV